MFEFTTLRRGCRSLLLVGWVLLVVAGWVVGLTLVFLATGWPRWAYYLAVIGGTLVLVRVTGSRPSTGSEDRTG